MISPSPINHSQPIKNHLKNTKLSTGTTLYDPDASAS
jgi:hypothetical protein